jgi:predicted CoA-binding protein
MGEAERSPVPGWAPPAEAELRAILASSRSVAIVGASSRRERPSFDVACYLLESAPEFELYFVNPRESEILGRPVFPSLRDLPVAPDLVDVFRRADQLPGVAEEAAQVGAGTLWLQLGLWSPEAARVALAAGMRLVMDRCLKVDHVRLCGTASRGGS